jgi:hypothetical protein
MPITYRHDDLANRLVTRCEGSVRFPEVVEHFRQLGRDPRIKPGCDVILDLSFQTAMPTPEQLDDIAAIIEDVVEMVPFGRCAVIAPEDVVYGLGRMFQGFTWPLFSGIKVLRTNAEAIAWLDEGT